MAQIRDETNVQGSEFRVEGIGLRVESLGFRVGVCIIVWSMILRASNYGHVCRDPHSTDSPHGYGSWVPQEIRKLFSNCPEAWVVQFRGFTYKPLLSFGVVSSLSNELL